MYNESEYNTSPANLVEPTNAQLLLAPVVMGLVSGHMIKFISVKTTLVLDQDEAVCRGSLM